MKLKSAIICFFILTACACILPANSCAGVFDIGPDKAYKKISDIDWDALNPGDIVQIHYKSKPYREKIALNRSGTKKKPIIIRGIPSSKGDLPILDGKGADHFQNSIDAGLIKRALILVGCDKPANNIVIENLELRNANNSNAFYFKGQKVEYASNANGILIKKGKNVKIKKCRIHACCVGVQTSYYPFVDKVLLSQNIIYNNGDFSGTHWGHNVYLCAKTTIVEFNHFGELHSDGNNIKDRSQTAVIRYNWIQGGMSRQIDMVETPKYPNANAFVYGNVIISGKKTKNPKMILFGGDTTGKDGKSLGRSRNGVLYFFNNTVHYTNQGLEAFLVVNRVTCQAIVYNNAFFGGNQIWIGAGSVLGSNNLLGFGAKPKGMINNYFGGIEQVSKRGNIRYIPSMRSLLVDRGTTKIPLAVKYMPLPLTGKIKRKIKNRLDIGAYELNAETISLK